MNACLCVGPMTKWMMSPKHSMKRWAVSRTPSSQMKQFTASISHELRTPLTALRGEAEVALLEARSVEEYKRVLASQLEEFDKLTHMINQLLVLARAEAGEIQWAEQAVDLSALTLSLD